LSDSGKAILERPMGDQDRNAAPRAAMVMAAGLGTRMRPYNGQIPKPLVSVGGKALIDHVLDRLAQAGVTRAVVNVHHLAEQIERHEQRPLRHLLLFLDQRAHGIPPET